MQITDDYIRMAETLLIGGHHFDEERISFIKQLRSCDLLAVPGSGKTTALLAKLYCMSKLQKTRPTSGILVLSHTNAAVEEIKNNLQTKCPTLFEYPNFVGTVQDFVDTFLAIPYYNKKYKHSISRIDSVIYNEQFLKSLHFISNDNPWNYYYRSFKNQILQYNVKKVIDGDFIPWNYDTQTEFKVMPKPPRTWEGHIDENRNRILDILKNAKQKIVSRGILNYEDCYVLAQIYIYESPRIKSILRKRFPFVFVDETQDLQIHQLEIIDHIFNTTDVCLQRIGDENQAIFNKLTKNEDCKWIPRNVITFNNSMRLTPENASVVNAFMLNRLAGQTVNGKRVLNRPISPYLLVYDYEHKDRIKDKFIELINSYELNDTVEGRKYGFHIIGWNARWSDDNQHIPNKLRLCDIFTEFAINKNNDILHLTSLADYISTSIQLKNTGRIVRLIYTVVSECLHMCNILEAKNYKGKTIYIPYTAYSIKQDIETKETSFVLNFKKRLIQVLKSICMHKADIAMSTMIELINNVLSGYGAQHSDALNNFLSEDMTNVSDVEETRDINIQFENVHTAKGHTHCATLYVETMYEGAYESIHVLNQIFKKATKKNPSNTYYPNLFYKEIGPTYKNSYSRSAIKMVYVGLSRPTHLLCYAMHKSSFEEYNAERLHNECGWEIIDLTED